MSRGHGRTQSSILKCVRDSAEPATAEQVRWTVFLQEYPGVTAEDSISPAWNSSFSRALSVLIDERADLVVEKRKLADLDEWVRHYPNKTLNGYLRDMRLVLLPALRDWLRSPNAPVAPYTAASNEAYFLKSLPESRLKQLSLVWSKLETDLRRRYAESGSPDVLFVLAKGAAMFSDLPISSKRSFVSGVTAARPSLKPHTYSALESFARDFLPARTASALVLHSQLHVLADVHKRGRVGLSSETMVELHRRVPKYIEAMSGFEPKRSTRISSYGAYHGPKFSPDLSRVIDRTAFSQFSFLSLAPPRHQR